MRILKSSVLVFAMLIATKGEGRGTSGRKSTHQSSAAHKSNYCQSCARSSNGKIHRSSGAKREFMKQSGFPGGRPGYVVDHVVPLKKGGSDAPSNMQWQTIEEAKAKDKWE